MTPLEQEDFLRGYADAEEMLIKPNFNLGWAIAYVKTYQPYDPYDEGFRMCLQEESDRINNDRK